MKRLLLGFLCFGAMGLLTLSSCQKAPELTITSPASVELSADGSNGTITFTANRGWTASSSDSWVTVSPSSGEASDKPVTVTVRSNANTTYDDRTATVTIRMEELSQTITVRQPANLGIIVPTQAFVLTSEGRTIDVEVQANVQYTVDISVDWIRQPGTKGLSTTQYSFIIAENTTYDDREGKITIKSQNTSVPDQIITVKQAQKDAILVKDTSFDLPYGGGEIEIKVEANVAFDVKPAVDWIHYVGTKGLSSSTLKLTIDENTTYSVRQGQVDISQQGGSIKHTVMVNQAGRIAVTSVELDQTTLSIKPGKTATLTATVKPDNATDKTVTWSTSDASVVTISNGVVTAIKFGSAIVSATAGNLSASCSVDVENPPCPAGAVDLGLSVFWATCNLSESGFVSSPEEYGDYYAWGETTTYYNSLNPRSWKDGKTGYNWASYSLCNGSENTLKKYNYSSSYGTVDNKTTLEEVDDVAHVKLGGRWRMPTDAEWDELTNNCTFEKTEQNGVIGYRVTSNKTGYTDKSIFFPYAGCMTGIACYDGGYTYYWSSSLYMNSYPYEAMNYGFGSHGAEATGLSRVLGSSVRPVSE